MWCVQHWSKDYGKTYGCNYGEIFFNTEKEATDYCERNKLNGRFKIVEKNWIETENTWVTFPLKIGLPIIVSRK